MMLNRGGDDGEAGMTHDETPRPDDGAAVIEWDGGEPDRAGRPARGLAALRSDPRIPSTVAGLSAFTLLLSLFSEWRLWTASRPDGPPIQLSNGVASFPVVGTAYLIGLLVLAGCAALALYGSPSARHNARLAGMAAAAVVGGVLVMAAASLEELGGVVETQVTNPQADANGWTVTVAHGRGLYLAFAGVAGTALALFLARTRHAPLAEPAARSAPAADEAAGAPARAPEDEGDGWPWRPSPDAAREAAGAGPDGGPLDLTVRPAEPFLPPGDTAGPR
jgi:hypothetical protein